MPRGFLLNSIPVNTPAGSELYKRRYIPSGDILKAPRRLQRPNSRSIDCRICVRLAFRTVYSIERQILRLLRENKGEIKQSASLMQTI